MLLKFYSHRDFYKVTKLLPTDQDPEELVKGQNHMHMFSLRDKLIA